MSKRTVPKRLHMGYALYVYRPELESWDRADGLFAGKGAALEYRIKHYPKHTKWRIQRVRVSAEKFTAAMWKE